MSNNAYRFGKTPWHADHGMRSSKRSRHIDLGEHVQTNKESGRYIPSRSLGRKKSPLGRLEVPFVPPVWNRVSAMAASCGLDLLSSCSSLWTAWPLCLRDGDVLLRWVSVCGDCNEEGCVWRHIRLARGRRGWMIWMIWSDWRVNYRHWTWTKIGSCGLHDVVCFFDDVEAFWRRQLQQDLLFARQWPCDTILFSECATKEELGDCMPVWLRPSYTWHEIWKYSNKKHARNDGHIHWIKLWWKEYL